MNWKVVAIDLDGTIVPGTTTGLYLAGRMGHLERMRDLEERYARGAISNRVVAEEDGRAFAGRTRAEVHALLADCPILGGVRETLMRLHAEGAVVILATVAWRFVADYFKQTYGFDHASGTDLGESPDGILTGRVTRHFDEHDKAAFVADVCRSRGVDLSELAAIGDSRSDVPLFGLAGRSIALNATPDARAAATHALAAADLREVLPLLER